MKAQGTLGNTGNGKWGALIAIVIGVMLFLGGLVAFDEKLGSGSWIPLLFGIGLIIVGLIDLFRHK